MEKRYYAAIHNNMDVWKKSSSGGAFTALTDAWFSSYGQKAAVYGCVLDNNLKARHVRAVTREQRDAMRGSKYIASDTTGIYKQVEEDLKDGNYVLYSGTPCQIAALNSYLRVKNIPAGQHLLTVEVICHGVGSNLFFEDYISDLERRYRSKAVSCSFRGKSRPEKIQEMYVTFENGKRHISPAARCDWFLTAYQRNYILRPVCFGCDLAKAGKADIGIGDHWAEQTSKARTLVIAESDVGNRWVLSLNESMILKELGEEEVHRHIPAQKPTDYERFWETYQLDGYLEVQKRLGNNTYRMKGKTAIVSIMYRLHITSLVKQLARRFRSLFK